ncbi:heterokaryon incompatibility protein-domain-containing protein [Aspergillus pseudoustus]|uniref:Heterokaryon incompatibility protein-domain-containing protein n=1 Tax=Aspergillus pseudoustus TaxID=1810923 RepID=A0ABR4KWC1_9EURO
MQPAVWDESCDWPRRLLHVPTMTSHPWQPGNIYGEHRNPSYNALSYTWGRWEINEHGDPETGGLRVAGIDWPTPRIMPTHFTVEELVCTIRAASTESDVRSTEFLWIDIACIDQKPSSKENASEVGRQAKIFKKADTVYVWLQSFDTVSFDAWLRYSVEHLLIPYLHASRTGLARGRVLTSSAIPEELLGDIERHIQRLSQDPWCTSLWTLQEGFLRPDAFILTRSPPDPARVLPDLPHALDWLGHIIADAQRSGLAHNNPRLGRIQRKALELGFVGVVHGSVAGAQVVDRSSVGSAENPFHLLACSAARQTSREEDRVYGIMQVFDLRLGKSAVGETRTDFAVQELQYQLEEALLAKYPVASQLVIQPKDCPLGKAWLVQSGGVVSTAGEVFWIALQDRDYAVTSLIKLSVRLCNGQRWGFFEGPLASLSSLVERFDIGVSLDQKWSEQMLYATTSGDTVSETTSEPIWSPADRLSRSAFPAGLELLRQYRGAHAAVNNWVTHRFPNLQVAFLGIMVLRMERGSLSVKIDGLCLDPLDTMMGLAAFQRVGTAGFTFNVRCNEMENHAADGLGSAEAAVSQFTAVSQGLFG